jgi:hypothetical protein
LTDRAVHSLAINPIAPDTLYGGTAGGGVFVLALIWNVFRPVVLRK